MIWDRKLWAVEFTGRNGAKMLIGSLWHGETMTRSYYDGEPARALLFQSRSAAREWCKAEEAKYDGRNDCCADWRFRPVRVRETVKVVK